MKKGLMARSAQYVAMISAAIAGVVGAAPGGQAEYDRQARRLQSKHRTHLRKNTGYGRAMMAAGARPIIHASGSKLAKKFAKGDRGPRGY